MRISDWSSDVCSSDLRDRRRSRQSVALGRARDRAGHLQALLDALTLIALAERIAGANHEADLVQPAGRPRTLITAFVEHQPGVARMRMLRQLLAQRIRVDRKSTRLHSSH